MARFRKKPIVVEAEQFRALSGCDGLVLIRPAGVVRRFLRFGWWIKTLEGWYPIEPDGTWIITGVKGEKYPCKHDIFEETHEPMLEDE